MINTFDIDGVIYMGKGLRGVYPGPEDVIITGRSFEEKPETIKMLEERGIKNPVFFNPLKYEEKTRETSGWHKARTIENLKFIGYRIGIHFEDDLIQAEIIKNFHPWLNVVILSHDLITKENVRHI